MRLLGHTLITFTIGGILYNYSHSLIGFLGFLVAGILIDLDHYIDYIRERGISFNFKKVCDVCIYAYMDFKKVTVLLHSYELLILLWLAIFIFNLDLAWKHLALGFTLHLFIDQMVNPVMPFSYFLSFRIANNFETKKTFKQRGVKYAPGHK